MLKGNRKSFNVLYIIIREYPEYFTDLMLTQAKLYIFLSQAVSLLGNPAVTLLVSRADPGRAN